MSECQSEGKRAGAASVTPENRLDVRDEVCAHVVPPRPLSGLHICHVCHKELSTNANTTKNISTCVPFKIKGFHLCSVGRRSQMNMKRAHLSRKERTRATRGSSPNAGPHLVGLANDTFTRCQRIPREDQSNMKVHVVHLLRNNLRFSLMFLHSRLLQ